MGLFTAHERQVIGAPQKKFAKVAAATARRTIQDAMEGAATPGHAADLMDLYGRTKLGRPTEVALRGKLGELLAKYDDVAAAAPPRPEDLDKIWQRVAKRFDPLMEDLALLAYLAAYLGDWRAGRLFYRQSPTIQALLIDALDGALPQDPETAAELRHEWFVQVVADELGLPDDKAKELGARLREPIWMRRTRQLIEADPVFREKVRQFMEADPVFREALGSVVLAGGEDGAKVQSRPAAAAEPEPARAR